MRSYLIVSDLHVPFHCQKYIDLTYKLLKNHPFSGVVQLGDFLDWWQLSTYDKDPSRKQTIVDDIKDFEKILTKWVSLLKKGSTVHLICGNHENRLSRYVSKHARELYEIVKPLPELLHLKERSLASGVEIKWHHYSKWNSCRIGNCTLFHGFYFNQHTAATNLAKYKVSTISGHTHRVQYVSDGYNFAASLGHGSDESETAHQPTPTGWQQAMGVLYVDDSGHTSLQILTVKDGRTIFNGKTF